MLLVSPELAQTLGLEEALLVQLIQQIQWLQGSETIEFSEAQRQRFLPFWSLVQFNLILQRLNAQGVVEIQGEQPWHIRCSLPDMQKTSTPAQPTVASQPTPPLPVAEAIAKKPQTPIKPKTIYAAPAQMPSRSVPVFTMNEARQRNQYDDDLAYLKQPAANNKQNLRSRKTAMQEHWEPSEDFPQLLSFHDIPLQFALSELAKFRQYYLSTDKQEVSWDVRFLNWVQRAWHDSLNSKGRDDRKQATNGEPANSARAKRSDVRDALRNIQNTDW